ncbi:hypothetical protein THASP1DRAFT_24120 [Thamnocephalis sphaerospora]|uniref:Uncharacterized protein n=1 Tax=Thamnocephalis sphaerospora TaxID=78915 RepID=A0A4P9XP67_9FUNG|nr:hypothetical protein THASP1DRAFT_24120 [Thamnocephalis sphaerospora]|eukprot:RKP07787.1 hypothetical protein THASP1DRAFT_24120 [Thamnocephalis sphaerospora]
MRCSTLAGALVAVAAMLLPSLADARPSDLTVPEACPHKTWKAVCQRYCLCQGYTIQANRCYAADECTLMCKCSGTSFTATVRNAFASAKGLTAGQCALASDDGTPPTSGAYNGDPICDGECHAKCDNYLGQLVRDPAVSIIPDGGDDSGIVVFAKKQ